MKSYAVINQPNEGTLAPYENQWFDYLSYTDKGHAATGDENDYDAYRELLKVYKGAEVIGTTYDNQLPTEANFVTPSGSGGRVKATETGTETDGTPYQLGDASYIYERRAPVGKDATPTVLIIYGTYTADNGSTKDCYYKIDLMEKGEYLALFRNFQYNVTIKSILKPGKNTVRDAYEGAGSGDISSDTNASNLSDISDGTVRLYVLEMAPVIVGQENDYQIQFKFVTDVATGDDSVNNRYGSETNPAITFTGGDGSGDVIESFTVDPVEEDSESHYRTLHFKTKMPSNSNKYETFRITAEHVTGSGESAVTHKLYRDVTFTLLNVQKLQVECIPEEVVEGVDENMTVRVTIPSGLPEAMFPLQFAIETANKSLNPRYDITGPEQNLPVKHDKTYQYDEVDGDVVRKDFNSYYFIRELTWAEYSWAKGGSAAGTYHAGSAGEGYIYFDSFLKTTKVASASEVYVGCLRAIDVNGNEKAFDYFTPGKDAFTNYTIRDFTWVTIPGRWEADTDQTLVFRVNTADIPEDGVTVTLGGNLTPASSGSGLSGTGVSGVYLVPRENIAADGRVSIKVHVRDTKGYPVSVTLSAKHYNDATTSGTIGKWVDKEVDVEREEDVVMTTTSGTVNNSGTYTGAGDFNLSFGGSYSRNTNYIQVNASWNNPGTISLSPKSSISGLPGYKLTKVVFNYTSSNNARADIAPSTGSYALNGSTGTWTGSATAGVTFTIDSYYYNNRISRITATYSYTTTETQHIYDTSRD